MFVASEFCGTSIPSQGPSAARVQALVDEARPKLPKGSQIVVRGQVFAAALANYRSPPPCAGDRFSSSLD